MVINSMLNDARVLVPSIVELLGLGTLFG